MLITVIEFVLGMPELWETHKVKCCLLWTSFRFQISFLNPFNDNIGAICFKTKFTYFLHLFNHRTLINWGFVLSAQIGFTGDQILMTPGDIRYLVFAKWFQHKGVAMRKEGLKKQIRLIEFSFKLHFREISMEGQVEKITLNNVRSVSCRKYKLKYAGWRQLTTLGPSDRRHKGLKSASFGLRLFYKSTQSTTMVQCQDCSILVCLAPYVAMQVLIFLLPWG